MVFDQPCHPCALYWLTKIETQQFCFYSTISNTNSFYIHCSLLPCQCIICTFAILDHCIRNRSINTASKCQWDNFCVYISFQIDQIFIVRNSVFFFCDENNEMGEKMLWHMSIQTTSQSINHHRHHHYASMPENLFQTEWNFPPIDIQINSIHHHRTLRHSGAFTRFKYVLHITSSIYNELVATRWQTLIQIHIWQHQPGICDVITWGLWLSENSRSRMVRVRELLLQ